MQDPLPTLEDYHHASFLEHTLQSTPHAVYLVKNNRSGHVLASVAAWLPIVLEEADPQALENCLTAIEESNLTEPNLPETKAALTAYVAYVRAAMTAARAAMTAARAEMKDGALLPAEESILAALRHLVKNAAPQPTGGFSPDDVSMHCNRTADEVQDYLYALTDRGLVRNIEADGNPWDTHYLPA
jgi:hypothetical protein